MSELEQSVLATRIQNVLGCGKDLAEDYAKAIGDKPQVENGQVVIRDEEGRIIAHLPMRVLE